MTDVLWVSLILTLALGAAAVARCEAQRRRAARIAGAVRAGEREAVALFLEYYEQDKLAAEVRAGAHLARLTSTGGKAPF